MQVGVTCVDVGPELGHWNWGSPQALGSIVLSKDRNAVCALSGLGGKFDSDLRAKTGPSTGMFIKRTPGGTLRLFGTPNKVA